MSHLKIINTCQSCIHKYENLKRKLYNCNANIYFNRTCLIQQNLSGAFCRTNIKRYLPIIIANCISHTPWTRKPVCSPKLWANGYHITQRDVQEDIPSSYGSWDLRLESISDSPPHPIYETASQSLLCHLRLMLQNGPYYASNIWCSLQRSCPFPCYFLLVLFSEESTN